MTLYYNIYPENVEVLMKQHYDSLNEKDKRRYAAIESLKIEYNGEKYISHILDIHIQTIKRGKKELIEGIDVPGRIRATGGGRHKIIDNVEEIHEKFMKIMEEHTAGSPMNEDIKWTNLSPTEISNYFMKEGMKISEHVVKQLLKVNGYVERKAQKNEVFKSVEHRDEQFLNIERLKKNYINLGINPIISIDVKKKEAIGNFYRDGKLYTKEILKVLDHDFASYADGLVIPHGVYDIQRNEGYVTIGTSKDTSEFACESIKDWWENIGRNLYPNATSILILADGGGSNSSRSYLFKLDLQNLANEIGIEIRIAHYPPYTSKYNPIEHRMFCHVTRACEGTVFKSLEIVKELIERTQTKFGLKVIVSIKDKIYQTGRKVSEDFKNKMTIVFDNYLGKWNYCAVPICSETLI
jgi:hypothetical protein